MKELHGFYTSLFTSERAEMGIGNGFEDTLQCLQHQISEDINARLVRLASAEDVQTTTYQMGGSRAPGPDGFPETFYQKN